MGNEIAFGDDIIFTTGANLERGSTDPGGLGPVLGSEINAKMFSDPEDWTDAQVPSPLGPPEVDHASSREDMDTPQKKRRVEALAHWQGEQAKIPTHSTGKETEALCNSRGQQVEHPANSRNQAPRVTKQPLPLESELEQAAALITESAHATALPARPIAIAPVVTRAKQPNSGASKHAACAARSQAVPSQPHRAMGRRRPSPAPAAALPATARPSSPLPAVPPALKAGQDKVKGSADSRAILPRQSRTEESLRFKLTWSQARTASVLGKGAFGQVSLIMHKQTGQLFARKAFSHDQPMQNMEEITAAEWLFAHPHNNVVQPTLAVFSSTSPPVPVAVHYELCQMSLEKFWRNSEGILNASLARTLGAHLLGGLAHMHHHGCLHRDIKPPNLLLQFDEERPLTLKIGDFGWLTRYHGEPSQGQPKLTSGAVTLPYRPPEILMNMSYGFPADARALDAACGLEA